MQSYLNLLKHVMENGEDRPDRTGVGTRGVFGYQWRHRMSDGFPLLTTKKVHWKSVITELCWFIKGYTNVRYLQERGVTIWDEWADKDGNLGPIYGKQWRRWDVPEGQIDQLKLLVHGLIYNPFSRRHIVTAWNPEDILQMKLPPCHTLWQCYVDTSDRLSLHLYARSIDSFLGLPFNIASYGALLLILARLTNREARDLVISFGDLHIYSNHFDQVGEQLKRQPRELPKLAVKSMDLVRSLDDIEPEDFELVGYDPHPAIKAPIAV
jgi:thymidylate synthase